MSAKSIQRWWLRYYTALWCVRCYVWNPLQLDWPFVERWFDKADLHVRKWVGKKLADTNQTI